MKRCYITALLMIAVVTTARAQLTNSGNLRFFAGTNVTFFGDVINNGTLTDNSTVVTFAGTVPQTIGGSSVTTFNNLTLNNSHATGVTLAQDMNVSGTLTFTDGYLNTTAANSLTLTSTASVSGAGNSSFVAGPVIKEGNTAFVFPVGKNVAYAPVAISAPGTVTDRFTAEYFQESPDALYSTASLEGTLDHVSQCEYWILDRSNGTSDVTVTLAWDAHSCGVTAMNDLRVARWDGAQWADEGNGGTTGNTTSGTIVTAAAITTFSPFTLASISSDNPLPVELVAFTAQCEEQKAVLRWTTASELHSDFFTIESSSDALEWKTIAAVDGAGNSGSPFQYVYADLSNPGRNSYYRLSQTDIDGTVTDHGTVYLENCAAADSEPVVYPNPSAGIVLIVLDAAITGLGVTNTDGKSIDGVRIDPADKLLDLSDLPDGVYFIAITTPEGTYNRRVVIAH